MAKPAPWRNRIIGHSEMPASQFLANPNNWRVHPRAQRAALRGLLREVGLVQEVIVNRTTGNVVDGHLRIDIALEEGDDTMVPYTIVELSEDEERKILAAFDSITALAATDDDKLRELLASITADDPALKSLYDDLAADVTPPAAIGDQDVKPYARPADDAQAIWQVKRGDVWEIESKTAQRPHRIMCGDSASATDVALLMGNARVALFATDPPYGVSYIKAKTGIPVTGFDNLTEKYSDIRNDELSGDELQSFLEAVFDAWLPYFDHTAVYLWHAALLQSRPPYDAFIAKGGLWHRVIIWVKEHFTLGRGGMYHWKQESCYYGWVQGYQPKWLGEHNQTTVWQIDRDHSTDYHPTQKPPALWYAPIQNHVLPHEICAEPFSGSGAQFLAGEQLGRTVYGMEITPEYVAVALQRLAEMGATPRRVVEGAGTQDE